MTTPSQYRTILCTDIPQIQIQKIQSNPTPNNPEKPTNIAVAVENQKITKQTENEKENGDENVLCKSCTGIRTASD